MLTPRGLTRATLAVAAATLVVGFIGFRVAAGPEGAAAHLFRAAGLLVLQPHSGPPNRWLEGAYVGAVLFSGLALGSLAIGLSGSAYAWWIGLHSRLRPRRAHAVIVGLGALGMQLLRDLRRGTADRGPAGGRRAVIALEADAGSPHVEEAQRLGALVLHGDGRASALRGKARLRLAREVFVTCGAAGVEVAAAVAGDLGGQPSRRSWGARRQRDRHLRDLQCHVHVADPQLAQVLATNDLLRPGGHAVDVHVFNVLDDAARQLLLREETGLARRDAPHDDEVAHYVLFGFGAIGQTVALHMARLAHFGNRRRLRMTVFVAGAEGGEETLRSFRDRHPAFAPAPGFTLESLVAAGCAADDWACRDHRPAGAAWRSTEPTAVEYAVNAELTVLDGEVDAPAVVERLIADFAPRRGPGVRGAVVLCFDDERRNFRSALRLRTALRQLAAEPSLTLPLPIHAHLPNEHGLASLLAEAADDDFPIHVFGQLGEHGLYERVVRPHIVALAEQIHQAYARSPGAPQGTRIAFADLPADLRRSNEEAAAHADVKLDLLGLRRRTARPGEPLPSLHLDETQRELLAEVEHNRWMAERLVAGWRFGPRDDRSKRREAFRAWPHLAGGDEPAKDARQIEALITALGVLGQTVEPAPAGHPAARRHRPAPAASSEGPGGRR